MIVPFCVSVHRDWWKLLDSCHPPEWALRFQLDLHRVMVILQTCWFICSRYINSFHLQNPLHTCWSLTDLGKSSRKLCRRTPVAVELHRDGVCATLRFCSFMMPQRMPIFTRTSWSATISCESNEVDLPCQRAPLCSGWARPQAVLANSLSHSCHAHMGAYFLHCVSAVSPVVPMIIGLLERAPTTPASRRVACQSAAIDPPRPKYTKSVFTACLRVSCIVAGWFIVLNNGAALLPDELAVSLFT